MHNTARPHFWIYLCLRGLYIMVLMVPFFLEPTLNCVLPEPAVTHRCISSHTNELTTKDIYDFRCCAVVGAGAPKNRSCPVCQKPN